MSENIRFIKDKILMSCLPDVPFDGWHWHNIQNAAIKAGYDKAMADALFPAKTPDVIDHLADWLDRQMLTHLHTLDQSSMKVRDRIKTAVMTRFGFMQNHRQAEEQALAFHARPLRTLSAGRTLWRTANCIWHWAGDTSTDYNYYTKRSLLSGILGATTLVWLTDKSDHLSTTDDFLERRIENIMQWGRFIGKIRQGS